MVAKLRTIPNGLTDTDLDSVSYANAGQPLSSVSLLLGSGGDRRIWSDAATGRNRYGTLTRPAGEEISFSSTTASNVSAEGYAAADRALKRLVGTNAVTPIPYDEWFDDVRDGVRRSLAVADAEVILAASGTDAEILALCLVAGLSVRPITNIFIAPDETGNGIPLAASGRHFSDLTALGRAVDSGELLEGFSDSRIEVRTVPIRDETGQQRTRESVDYAVAGLVEQELRRGRDVLVHVLDTSKTGLEGVSRETARQLAAAAPGRVRILIDACQLRCPLSQLRQDLNDGFLVAVTGSKLAAGPPFSGALLIPASTVDELARCRNIPAGLAEYTAAQDWPASLRQRTDFGFKSEMNIGLSLRWVAALANLVPYAAVDEMLRAQIKQHFVDAVLVRATDLKGVQLHPNDEGAYLASRGIVPLTVLGGNGGFASFDQAQADQVALRSAAGGPICHIGQAVRIGPRVALRIGASATDIAGVAARMAAGETLQDAFKPIEADLDTVFAKWSGIRRHPFGA
ncbi:hypothetical protein [Hyphomicrobium sp.]|uniref:hypothetical protein n=1 Tax=Hyphomicrobium sp. TaxID=82 RepID=UPI001D40C06F|nr:hypothetical protein [Hyphomicrobium sp.]MBY0561844.1 hypothetical protein [Hyphomicrobium sp.]